MRHRVCLFAVICAGAHLAYSADAVLPAGEQMTRPADAVPPDGAQMTRPADAMVPVSLPDVNNFPELYRGVPISLDQVELDWKMIKEFDYYCLGLSVKEGERNRRAQDRGEYTPPFLNRQRVTFIASPDIARELLDRTELDTTYPVRIRCTVGIADELIRELGNVYWVARVERIDCLRGDGGVAWTLPAPGPTRAEAAPIAAEIEKYSDTGPIE